MQPTAHGLNRHRKLIALSGFSPSSAVCTFSTLQDGQQISTSYTAAHGVGEASLETSAIYTEHRHHPQPNRDVGGWARHAVVPVPSFLLSVQSVMGS
jgi:hypothetical protein